MPTVTTTYVIGNGSNGAGANQIVSETTSGVTTDYAYDGNGNRSSRTVGGETDTYTYDDENRLIELVEETGESPGTYTYAYDYRTRRVTRTEPGPVTTQVVFDGGLSIEEFTTSASSPTVEYVRGHDYGGGVGGLEYSVRSGTPSFNFYDSRGDVTTKTNASGTVTYQTGYEAFGNQTVSTGTTPLDRQRASTKEQDPTGLLNEGFRYRDPSTGTFLTRDPLGFKAGPNMYTYVRQNPWTHFDPEGLYNLSAISPIQFGKDVVWNTILGIGNVAIGFGKAAYGFGQSIANAGPSVVHGDLSRAVSNISTSQPGAVRAVAGQWANNFLASSKTPEGAEQNIGGALTLMAGVRSIKVPQGLTGSQFNKVADILHTDAGHISSDIVVQGSRATGTAAKGADIDFAVRVNQDNFNQIASQKFKTPNAGSAKERTMNEALAKGRIHTGEAKLGPTQERLVGATKLEVDLSIVERKGPFDQGPTLPVPKPIGRVTPRQAASVASTIENTKHNN
jgi:RHS repeat-associated protein